uniref:Uncharacterized protein n=1 Tax=Meloidogyne enterolobii TaxID=390850 RepID=A0A6V7W5Q9_MELEN|nr:unnamed protein product [Meloidogyne enterolobii]
MFSFLHFPLIIFLIFNFILIKFGCLPSKSFVILRDEDKIKDNEKIKGFNEIPKKFMLKCPKTPKNISKVEWSHNTRVIFKIKFTQDGTPEPILNEKDNPKWSIHAKAWHSIDKNVAMILTAKNEKFKVEIELERKNNSKNSKINFHQWMVLRINKIDIEEDEGIWKCQIFVNDERNKGRLKLEGESRKRIVRNFFRNF